MSFNQGPADSAVSLSPPPTPHPACPGYFSMALEQECVCLCGGAGLVLVASGH